MDLLHNVILLRCPDSDKEFTPVSPSIAHLSASVTVTRYCTMQQAHTQGESLHHDKHMLLTCTEACLCQAHANKSLLLQRFNLMATTSYAGLDMHWKGHLKHLHDDYLESRQVFSLLAPIT